MNSNDPIGIFDSGIGGLSVYKELIKLLPREQFLYLADSKNAPYGTKPRKKILELSERNTQFLLEKKVKMIVVACNTATTQVIRELRKKYSVPFIGVEPAVKPAAENSRTKKIGILATEGTLRSNLFKKTFDRYGGDVEAIIQVGTGLVELIEKNDLEAPELSQLLSSYLKPMLDKKIDSLVLGCTHYPFLIPIIKAETGNSITIYDPAPAVAARTIAVLKARKLISSNERKNEDQFYTNADTKTLNRFVKTILNPRTSFTVLELPAHF